MQIETYLIKGAPAAPPLGARQASRAFAFDLWSGWEAFRAPMQPINPHPHRTLHHKRRISSANKRTPTSFKTTVAFLPSLPLHCKHVLAVLPGGHSAPQPMSPRFFSILCWLASPAASRTAHHAADTWCCSTCQSTLVSCFPAAKQNYSTTTSTTTNTVTPKGQLGSSIHKAHPLESVCIASEPPSPLLWWLSTFLLHQWPSHNDPIVHPIWRFLFLPFLSLPTSPCSPGTSRTRHKRHRDLNSINARGEGRGPGTRFPSNHGRGSLCVCGEPWPASQ